MKNIFGWQQLQRWGGNVLFFLFLLTIMLDPTDTVLGLKTKLFVLLFAYNAVFFKPSFRFLPHIVAVYVVLALGYISAVLQGNVPDPDWTVAAFKAFSPLALLLWIHHYDVLRLSLIPAFLVAVIVLVIFGLSSYDEKFEGIFYLFVKQHNDMIMMTNRYLLGFRFFGVYFKSFVCLALPLFFCYYQAFIAGKRRWLYGTVAVVMTLAFMVSGTRATMLLPFYIIGLISYRYISNLRMARYFLYPVVALCALMFVGLVVMLASESGEASNTIKFAHIASYGQLFEDNPHYILLGQGMATKFYSVGFHRLTLETEWTYLELIRSYGLAALLIVFVVLSPMIMLWRNRSNQFVVGVMGVYAAYLFIAGTNPLLTSSTGMQVILCAYSLGCLYEKLVEN